MSYPFQIYREGVDERLMGVEGNARVLALQEELWVLERDRDDLLSLLNEIADADSADELEEVAGRIRQTLSLRPYPLSF